MKAINIKVFPDDVHREAKAQAAKEGKTLQDWIIEAVKEKLERSKEIQ
ncbi:3-hydroxyacyl-CoA dehydrogenase [Solidesulfovibrio sp. C21]